MNAKRRVGIIFGGKSAEHEVSITSATAISNNIDKNLFSPVLIYVDKNGRWRFVNGTNLTDRNFPTDNLSSFVPWETREIAEDKEIDIYFPIIHGPNGEDGKIQGFLEMAGKPYVGANSISSALAMDKVVSKILFQKAGILTPEFLFFTKTDHELIFDEVDRHLGFPVFVKPASLGSSVGIRKVKNKEELLSAMLLAYQYDRKIIIEKAIDAREIEVSVMGNDTVKVSVPGELVPHNEFYDYQDKYVGGKTTFHIPAELPPEIISLIRETAEKAYRSHFLNGMARVDFLLERETNLLFINEMNTIPGFTEISMFPKLWNLESISFKELISHLIELGFEFFQSDPSLHTNFTDWGSK